MFIGIDHTAIVVSDTVDPSLAFPVMIGATSGAWTGARVLTHANVRWLRQLFTAIVVVAAIEMLYKGLTGAI